MNEAIFGVLWLILANELIIKTVKAIRYYSIQKEKNYIEGSSRLRILKINIIGSICYSPICIILAIEFLLKGIYGWNHIESEYTTYITIVMFAVSILYYTPSICIEFIGRQKKEVLHSEYNR